MINRLFGRKKDTKSKGPIEEPRVDVRQALYDGEIPSNMRLSEIAFAFLILSSQDAKRDFIMRYVETIIKNEDEILFCLSSLLASATKERNEEVVKIIKARIDDVRSMRGRFGERLQHPEPAQFLINRVINLVNDPPRDSKELEDRFMECLGFINDGFANGLSGAVSEMTRVSVEFAGMPPEVGKYVIFDAFNDASEIIRRIYADIQENRNLSAIRERISKSEEFQRIVDYYCNIFKTTDNPEIQAPNHTKDILSQVFGKENISETMNLFLTICIEGDVPSNMPLPGIVLALLFPPLFENQNEIDDILAQDTISRYAKEICEKQGEIAAYFKALRRQDLINPKEYMGVWKRGLPFIPSMHLEWVDKQLAHLPDYARRMMPLAKRPTARIWLNTILHLDPIPKKPYEFVTRIMLGTSFYDEKFIQELKQLIDSVEFGISQSDLLEDLFHKTGENWRLIYGYGTGVKDIYQVVKGISEDIQRNESLRQIRKKVTNRVETQRLIWWLMFNKESDSLLERINNQMAQDQ